MEPLRTNKSLLTWLGMCPPVESTTKEARSAYFRVATIFFIMDVFSMLVTTAFVVVFVSTQLTDALFAFMCDTAYFSIFYTLLNAFNLRSKMNHIFVRLTEICSECTLISFEIHWYSKHCEFILRNFQIMTLFQFNSWHAQKNVANG